MTNDDTKKPQKTQKYFKCEICYFKCSNKKDYMRHEMTAKHQMMTNDDTKPPENPQKHKCSCGKEYSSRQSLHRHKNKCNYEEKEENIIEKSDEPDYKELLFEAMEQMKKKDEIVSDTMEQMKQKDEQVSDAMTQMKEHQKQITDMLPLIGHHNNNKTTNNNTTNNNKFNLNFFLNTQCKDAMSIQSFMENLSIGSKELEHMGDVGFLNGMIDIFNNTIGNMDIHKRPLHCTDKKREVLYFKQGDEWEKDSTDKQQLKKLIKDVETKNYYNVRDWSRAHKDSFTSETAAGDQYMKIATEALGGADSTKDTIYLSKIMKHIIREVTVKA